MASMTADLGAMDGAERRLLAPGQRWYLAHTLPHKETTAEMRLADQGFHVFLPRRLKTVRHARRMRTVNAPLFPRYLFVAFDIDRAQWRSINGTIGVATLFMARERPLAVPDGVVETLIQSSDRGGCLRFDSELTPGQQVRLIAGPFTETLGVLDHLDARGRVEVLLNIMGSVTRVRLHRELLEPAA